MKKTNKLLVLLLVMLMAMSLFMTGCGSDSEEGQEGQEAGGTLVIALQEEIEGTDIQQIGKRLHLPSGFSGVRMRQQTKA